MSSNNMPAFTFAPHGMQQNPVMLLHFLDTYVLIAIQDKITNVTRDKLTVRPLAAS